MDFTKCYLAFLLVVASTASMVSAAAIKRTIEVNDGDAIRSTYRLVLCDRALDANELHPQFHKESDASRTSRTK